MESTDKVEQLNNELATKIKIPKDIREAIYSKLFKNLCIAISIFIYFIFVNLGYNRLEGHVFESDLHMFAAILIIFTVIVFEAAYRNGDTELGLHGIESLVISVLTLFMPFVYFHREQAFKYLYSFSAIYVAIYYVIKCVVIYVKEVKKYKAGMSDIRELLQQESAETYLDERNKRKFSEE